MGRKRREVRTYKLDRAAHRQIVTRIKNYLALFLYIEKDQGTLSPEQKADRQDHEQLLVQVEAQGAEMEARWRNLHAQNIQQLYLGETA